MPRSRTGWQAGRSDRCWGLPQKARCATLPLLPAAAPLEAGLGAGLPHPLLSKDSLADREEIFGGDQPAGRPPRAVPKPWRGAVRGRAAELGLRRSGEIITMYELIFKIVSY